MNKRETEKSKSTVFRGILLSVLVCVCIISVIAAAISSSFVCYAVSYDGEELGTVSSRSELNYAIEEADAMAAEILGEEHPVYGGLAVTTKLSSGAGSADTLADALLESVDGIEYHPTLTVDGNVVASAESEDIIHSVLEGILDRYTHENTISVSFAQDVSISAAYVNTNTLMDAAGLADMLDPENADSDCRLTVVSREINESYETVPFEVEVTYDDQAYSDESTVTQEGVDGQRLNAYISVMENGKEVTTYLGRSNTITVPVPKCVTVGTIPGSRTDSTGSYIWPTTGVITSKFGHRDTEVGSTEHRGIDIGNSVGTTVVAADGGTVIYAQDSEGNYGNFIKIKHDDGTVTCYAHLNKILVKVGDKVAQGEKIAEMGMTGRVTGPHLHFEVRPNGVTPVNPTKYLSGKPARK